MATAKPTPILFLDLDGTVILGREELGHFIKDPTEVELFPGVLDKLKDYKAQGWRLVIISNQGGVALGHIAENTLTRIMEEVQRLSARLFDGTLWCVHHPDAKGETKEETLEKSWCFCRKPMTGLLHFAIENLSKQYPDEFYRPWACLFVGDLESDRQCAENFGIEFVPAKIWRDAPELPLPSELV